jgi:hypothetical protein
VAAEKQPKSLNSSREWPIKGEVETGLLMGERKALLKYAEGWDRADAAGTSRAAGNIPHQICKGSQNFVEDVHHRLWLSGDKHQAQETEGLCVCVCGGGGGD